jgi:hypothetical protein
MNRPLKALAIAAFALAGALGATAVQASAANFNVHFAIKNADSSASMLRQTNPLPSTVTGLIAPPSAISPAALDPASGFAVYSDTLPANNTFKQALLVYANAVDGISNPCTFVLKVSKDSNALPYLLHISATWPCSAPADVRSSDGQFTSQTYVLSWTT